MMTNPSNKDLNQGNASNTTGAPKLSAFQSSFPGKMWPAATAYLKSGHVNRIDLSQLSGPLACEIAARLLKAMALGVSQNWIIRAVPGAGKTTLACHMQVQAVEHARQGGFAKKLSVLIVTPTHQQANDFIRRLVIDMLPQHVKHADVRIIAVCGQERHYDLSDLPAGCEEFVLTPAGAKQFFKALDDCKDHHTFVITNTTKLEFLCDSLSKLNTGEDSSNSDGSEQIEERSRFKDGEFDYMVCDEAFQVAWMRYQAFVRLSTRHVLIGDCGQIPPFFPEKLHDAGFVKNGPTIQECAPDVFLRFEPLRIHTQVALLQQSYRLPHSTVEIVQPCLYSDQPFRGVELGVERFTQYTLDPKFINRTTMLDVLEQHIAEALGKGQSILLVELPATQSVNELDTEALNLMYAVQQRLCGGHLLLGQARAQRPAVMQPLNTQQTMFLVSRQIEKRYLRDLMSNASTVVDFQGLRQGHAAAEQDLEHLYEATSELVFQSDTQAVRPLVGTANELQGLEADVTFSLNPLIGCTELNGFNLEPGRLCVMATRHRHLSVMFTRANVRALFEGSPRCEERSLINDLGQATYRGFLTYQKFYDLLEKQGGLIRLD